MSAGFIKKFVAALICAFVALVFAGGVAEATGREHGNKAGRSAKKDCVDKGGSAKSDPASSTSGSKQHKRAGASDSMSGEESSGEEMSGEDSSGEEMSGEESSGEESFRGSAPGAKSAKSSKRGGAGAGAGDENKPYDSEASDDGSGPDTEMPGDDEKDDWSDADLEAGKGTQPAGAKVDENTPHDTEAGDDGSGPDTEMPDDIKGDEWSDSDVSSAKGSGVDDADVMEVTKAGGKAKCKGSKHKMNKAKAHKPKKDCKNQKKNKGDKDASGDAPSAMPGAKEPMKLDVPAGAGEGADTSEAPESPKAQSPAKVAGASPQGGGTTVEKTYEAPAAKDLAKPVAKIMRPLASTGI